MISVPPLLRLSSSSMETTSKSSNINDKLLSSAYRHNGTGGYGIPLSSRKSTNTVRSEQMYQTTDDDDDDNDNDYQDEEDVYSNSRFTRESKFENVQNRADVESIRGPLESIREEKIVELAKKIKALNMQLEREKSQNSQLTKDLKKQREEISEYRNSLNCNQSQKGEGESGAMLKDRLKYLERKSEQDQIKMETLKRDLKIASKIIKAEIGPFESFSDLSKETLSNASWKGRSQQISLLKEKIKEMEGMKMNGSGGGNGDLICLVDDRIGTRQQHSNLQSQLDNAQLQVQMYQEESEKLKQKLKSSKARIKVLEDGNAELKHKLGIVLEKTALDDEMIRKLQSQS